MRVIIILAAIAFTHGAKLENTYLPPSNARTAGGSGNFLQAPTGPSSAPARNAYTQAGNAQSGIARFGNGIPQTGNGVSQIGNGIPQLGNGIPQSGNDFAKSGAEYGNVNFNYANARPERPRAAFERNAAILRQDNNNDGETFSYAFETENGIYAEESGVATNGVEAQGGYSYTGDDGQVYSVRYTADQNGFVPQGDHLPTPPPVPEEILKALEQNARDEAAGIYDDGSYNEGKYAGADNSNYNAQYNYQNQNANNAVNGNDFDTVVTNAAFARSGNGIGAYSAAFNGRKAGNTQSFTAGIAPTYGAPNAQSTRAFGSTAGNAPSFGSSSAGIGSSFNAATAGNTPSFATTRTGTSSFNAPSGPRNSGAEKAYLPPLADQRGQARNGFGSRQQTFDDKNGYQY